MFVEGIRVGRNLIETTSLNLAIADTLATPSTTP